MKKIKKLLSILMVSTMLMSLMTITASAATANSYTPVAGGTTTFNKVLIVEDGANIPEKDFTFTIVPGTAVAATSSTMGIIPGPTATGAPTVSRASFTSGAPSTDDAQGTNSGTPDAKYASQTVTVNLTGVTFPEPGVYRYVITEDTLSAPYSNASGGTLYLDVFVKDVDGALNVDSYILHTGNDVAALSASPAEVPNKTNKVVNEYSTNDITLSKTVSGNQASKDKYFKITLKVDSELTDTDTFTVDLTHAVASPATNAATSYETAAMTNAASVTGAQLEAGVDFYLQHGQEVTIQGLPAGVTYTVTEAEEEYTPSLAVSGATATVTNNKTGTGSLTNDVTAEFTNTRNGVIPTGVLLTIAPFAVGILLFGAMFIFMVSKRRREAY
jgi:hypothetical protein